MTRIPEFLRKFCFHNRRLLFYSRRPEITNAYDNSKNHRSRCVCALLLFTGCSKKANTTKVVNSKHVKIGIIGLTCEAPIFTAYEKGFFKEEGLEPELVKCELGHLQR